MTAATQSLQVLLVMGTALFNGYLVMYEVSFHIFSFGKT